MTLFIAFIDKYCKKTTEDLLVTTKENSLEVSTETRKYIFESHEQNTGQNYHTKEDNISFKNVTKLASLETPITNQNCMHEEIISRLNARNACYN
jgi:hypothetical protein